MLGNNKKFSNEIILNQSLQCSVLGRITFKNLTFKNVDFTGTFFSKIIFENCKFLKSNLKASYFMNSEFKETIFKNSHLDLIMVKAVKVWKSDEWIQIENFSNFEKLLIDNNLK